MVGEALPLPFPPTAVALVFGLIVGSFLNVVVHRMPRGESLLRPASRCPACGRAIRAWENVPVVSYAWLRGRCRGCRVRISVSYPLVELATGLLFAAVAFRHPASLMAPLWMVFCAALLAAALIDLEHRIIPDEISLGGLGVGLVGIPFTGWLDGADLLAACLHSLTGALLGGGMLWIVGFAHARLSVAMGRSFEHWPGPGEELPRPGALDYWVWFPGMGFGDIKLLAMIGAFLGPIGVVATILVASGVGLVFGLGWALLQRRWDSPFGFGPAIAFGAIGVVLAPSGWLPF